MSGAKKRKSGVLGGKTTPVKGQMSLKSFFFNNKNDKNEKKENEEMDVDGEKPLVENDADGDEKKKKSANKSNEQRANGTNISRAPPERVVDDEEGTFPSSSSQQQQQKVNKRQKIREDDEEEERDDKMFAIPERDSALRERFNAKLVAKATTTTGSNAMSIRGRGQAFKKQREEEEDVADEKLDEIEPKDKKLTPLEAQVKDMKRKHPSVLLLFEVGYKFHFYGKDARKAAETLNVFAYPGKTWLQASGPVHRLAVYVRRLVNAGHKVGVVRQTETAALKAEGSTKGSVFTRELVALYTKATMDAGVSIAAEPVNNNDESGEAPMKVVDSDENKIDRGNGGGEENEEVIANQRKSSTMSNTTANKQQQQQLSNYLLCISEEKNSEGRNKDEIALVAIETSVGNIYHAHFEDDSSRSKLESALLKISPCEIVFAGGGEESSSSKETKRLVSALFPDARIEQSNSVVSSLSKAEIDEYFGPQNSEKVANLPRLLIATLAAAREYLVPFKLENVLKLSKAIKPLDDVQSEMILSPNAIRQLEIFRNSDDGSFTGSLLWLIDHAKSKAGSRELSRWVSRPLRDRAEIENRLSVIEKLRAMNSAPTSVVALEKLEKTLRTAPDVERVVARAHHLNATPAEFVAAMQFFLSFGAACVETQQCVSLSGNDEKSPLNELLSACADEGTLRACTKALNALDLTVANSKAGNLGCSRDAYVGLFLRENEDNQKQFPEMFQAHDNLEKSKAAMDALLPDLAAQIPGIIKGAKLSYTSVGGASGAEYLIEVSDKLKPPNDWIKVSANKSKKVIRYHPPIVLENMKSLEANSERLALACEGAWKSFLREFSRVSYGECRQAAKAAAKIDALNALAILSMNDGYCRPEFFNENEENEDGTARIEIIKGRHPTLDAKMVDKFVPNSASLGGVQPPGESSENNLTPRRRRAMILTGPNMGGKSCFARQVALIAILAHIGSFVPAQSCRLSVLDGIYTRAGAADNLALGQSTFFQEMIETSAILKSCSKKSLVVLDELGRGTSTSDGIALATATLRMLVEKVQCATVFVTHFSNLAKQFKESNADEVFCCFPGHVKTSDEKDSKRITFLYTLEEGVAHRSFGLNVASMAGIPERVLEVAEVKSLAFEESSTRKSVRNDAEEVDKMVRDALSLESSNIAKIEETQRALRLRL
jgi:DNA mismatch repair protein MSH3